MCGCMIMLGVFIVALILHNWKHPLDVLEVAVRRLVPAESPILEHVGCKGGVMVFSNHVHRGVNPVTSN